jgi:hypothetical protein
MRAGSMTRWYMRASRSSVISSLPLIVRVAVMRELIIEDERAQHGAMADHPDEPGAAARRPSTTGTTETLWFSIISTTAAIGSSAWSVQRPRLMMSSTRSPQSARRSGSQRLLEDRNARSRSNTVTTSREPCRLVDDGEGARVVEGEEPLEIPNRCIRTERRYGRRHDGPL